MSRGIHFVSTGFGDILTLTLLPHYLQHSSPNCLGVSNADMIKVRNLHGSYTVCSQVQQYNRVFLIYILTPDWCDKSFSSGSLTVRNEKRELGGNRGFAGLRAWFYRASDQL